MSTVPPAASPVRVATAIALAVIVATAVNALIGLVMLLIDERPLRLPSPAIAYSVIGVLAGALGWALVRRFLPHPAAVLRVLVPAVVIVSFVPDLLLYQYGPIHTTVIGFMIMHVVCAVVAVPAFQRVLPVGPLRARSAPRAEFREPGANLTQQ